MIWLLPVWVPNIIMKTGPVPTPLHYLLPAGNRVAGRAGAQRIAGKCWSAENYSRYSFWVARVTIVTILPVPVHSTHTYSTVRLFTLTQSLSVEWGNQQANKQSQWIFSLHLGLGESSSHLSYIISQLHWISTPSTFPEHWEEPAGNSSHGFPIRVPFSKVHVILVNKCQYQMLRNKHKICA